MIARLLFLLILAFPLAVFVGALVFAVLVGVPAYVAEWMTEDRDAAAELERRRRALRRAVRA